MTIKKEEKAAIISELKEALSKYQVLILSDYRGLDVESMNALRKQLREENAEFRVVKNTLLRIASEGTDLEQIKDQFVGPTAITISSVDPVSPAKVLKEFSKSHDSFQIKGGILSGKPLTVSDIEGLAGLPERDVLLAQLMSVFNASQSGLVNVLTGVIRGLVNVLHAVEEKKAA
jgi:large subunit ribosomal protein L10